MDSDGRLMIIVLELKRHLLGAGKPQLLSAPQGREIRRRKQVTRLTWRRHGGQTRGGETPTLGDVEKE